jgi:hypothetical protein
VFQTNPSVAAGESAESASILLFPFHFYLSPPKLRKQFWEKVSLDLRVRNRAMVVHCGFSVHILKMQASERFAERVAPVAQTTHPSQAGLARVLNSLVVPPFLRRGSWRSLLKLSLEGFAFTSRNNS